MGCASSSPLVENGKNFIEGAKDSVSETLTKGGKVLEDVGETAKEGISSGLDTVKETVHTAVTTAENGVENVMGKLGETFNLASSKATDLHEDIESKKHELVANVSDTAAEAISEAETVVVSEAENAKEAFTSKASPVFETVHSIGEEMEHKASEIQEDGIEFIEDIEEHVLGDNVHKMETKPEEILKTTSTESPVKELVKEELQPTFWEAAADAILLQRTIKSMDFRDVGIDKKNYNQQEIYDTTNELIKDHVKDTVND
ncbi:alanine--tRNA ligase-like [Diorhabda carinulata]|uniref:alanine--tRNA ligase-like n=1 Tax=Diorhabda carinulata TaxID=1163345 RepID=UPI0025A16EFC|nr:alanine--tRNA ligase-like [Diorhabda carinulata]